LTKPRPFTFDYFKFVAFWHPESVSYCSRVTVHNTKLKIKIIHKSWVIHLQWEATELNFRFNQQNTWSELTIRNFTRCFLMPQFYMLQHIPPLLCLVRAIGTRILGCLATVQWRFPSVWFSTTCFMSKYVAQLSIYGVSDWRVWWPTHPVNIHCMLGFLGYFLERFITQLKTFMRLISCCLINTPWHRSCKISMIQSQVILLQSFIEFCPLNNLVYLQN
jgi:hypothetical protein